MNDSVAMGRFEPLEDTGRDFDGASQRQESMGIELIPEGASVEILHRHEVPVSVGSHLIDRDDIRVGQGSCRFDFALKSFDPFVSLLGRASARDRQFLERDSAVHQGIVRLVNDVVRARDLPDDLIFAQSRRGAIHGAVRSYRPGEEPVRFIARSFSRSNFRLRAIEVPGRIA